MSTTKMPGFTAECSVYRTKANYPGRLTPSAGGAASEPAAIGLVAINGYAEYRSADSALPNLNYVYLRDADMTPGTPAINPRTCRN